MTTTWKTKSRVAILSVVLLAAGALQAQVCSNTTTVGRYMVLCNGQLSPAPNTPLVPAKVLGTSYGDSSGTFNGTATVTIGGLVVTQTVTGKAKLNKDCTGTISYTQTLGGQPGPPLDLYFVVSQQGERIDGISTDTNVTMSCVLLRLSNEEPPATASAANRDEPELTARLQSRGAATSIGRKLVPRAGNQDHRNADADR